MKEGEGTLPREPDPLSFSPGQPGGLRGKQKVWGASGRTRKSTSRLRSAVPETRAQPSAQPAGERSSQTMSSGQPSPWQAPGPTGGSVDTANGRDVIGACRRQELGALWPAQRPTPAPE